MISLFIEMPKLEMLNLFINVKMATTTNLPQSNVEMAEASVIYGEMGSDEWISDIVVSADNVSFLVAENNTGKDRMATLTVSFPAAYEGEGVSTSLWISQSSEDAYLRFDSDEYAVNPDGGTVVGAADVYPYRAGGVVLCGEPCYFGFYFVGGFEVCREFVVVIAEIVVALDECRAGLL